MGRVAEVLGGIYEQGMADLVGISSYLEALRPEGMRTGTDAYRMVLGDLGAFRLPPMVGLVREGQPKIADQVAWAQEFANYSLFMEPSAKRRARAAIEGFRDAPQRPEPEEGAWASSGRWMTWLRRWSGTWRSGRRRTGGGC